MAHYDRNSGSHISGMVAQACRTGGSLEHRLFNELNREMNKLYTILEELSKNERSGFLLKQLQVLTRRESRFAAFKRCYIRENAKKYIDYLE